MQGSGIDLRTLSDTNRISVLKTIYEEQNISRTRLAGVTGLSLSAVSRVVKELIEQKLVRETGLGDSSGGRKPVNLCVNPEAGYVVGVDFGKTKVAAGAFDFSGKQVFHCEETVQEKRYLDALYAAIDKSIAAPEIKGRILLIYCGVRGYIESSTGTILFSKTFGWENVPIRKLLMERYGVPVEMEINAQLAALGEWKEIYKEKVDNLVFVTTSWGICAGVISRREMFRGSRGMAGEIGNTVNFTGSRQYNLEESCGGQMLIRRAQERWGEPENFLLRRLTEDRAEEITVENIIVAANAGDVFAGELIQEAADALACGLLNVVYTYNPDVIVIGGLLAELGNLILAPVKERLSSTLHQVIWQQVSVHLTVLGGRASLLGAAEAAFQSVFASPIDQDSSQSINI